MSSQFAEEVTANLERAQQSIDVARQANTAHPRKEMTNDSN